MAHRRQQKLWARHLFPFYGFYNSSSTSQWSPISLASTATVSPFQPLAKNSLGRHHGNESAGLKAISEYPGKGAASLLVRGSITRRECTDSPLWKILHNHYEDFKVGYHEHSEKQYGSFRPVVVKSWRKISSVESCTKDLPGCAAPILSGALISANHL